jgi:hypothetical protein
VPHDRHRNADSSFHIGVVRTGNGIKPDRRIVEEAALAGIPAIVIDPNNDLSRLGDAWPERPTGFTAEDEAKAARYTATVEVVVWTPGIHAGNPLFLSVLPDFAAVGDDPDERAQAVTMAADTLGPLAGAKTNLQKGVLADALRAFATGGARQRQPCSTTFLTPLLGTAFEAGCARPCLSEGSCALGAAVRPLACAGSKPNDLRRGCITVACGSWSRGSSLRNDRPQEGRGLCSPSAEHHYPCAGLAPQGGNLAESRAGKIARARTHLGSQQKASLPRRRVVDRNEQAVFDLTDQQAVLGMRDALDLGPFSVGHEGRPRGGSGCFIRPFQEIDELCPVAEPGFPHRDDQESVSGSHDACSMIAKAGMKRRFVLFEDFVDAELLDQGHLPLVGTYGNAIVQIKPDASLGSAVSIGQMRTPPMAALGRQTAKYSNGADFFRSSAGHGHLPDCWIARRRLPRPRVTSKGRHPWGQR